MVKQDDVTFSRQVVEEVSYLHLRNFTYEEISLKTSLKRGTIAMARVAKGAGCRTIRECFDQKARVNGYDDQPHYQRVMGRLRRSSDNALVSKFSITTEDPRKLDKLDPKDIQIIAPENPDRPDPDDWLDYQDYKSELDPVELRILEGYYLGEKSIKELSEEEQMKKMKVRNILSLSKTKLRIIHSNRNKKI